MLRILRQPEGCKEKKGKTKGYKRICKILAEFYRNFRIFYAAMAHLLIIFATKHCNIFQ